MFLILPATPAQIAKNPGFAGKFFLYTRGGRLISTRAFRSVGEAKAFYEALPCSEPPNASRELVAQRVAAFEALLEAERNAVELSETEEYMPDTGIRLEEPDF